MVIYQKMWVYPNMQKSRFMYKLNYTRINYYNKNVACHFLFFGRNDIISSGHWRSEKEKKGDHTLSQGHST